ncbi:peptide-binding protein [Capsulimonas corticalis]|uniref:Peptide-binding protein n=1 Tax=Capsulimonas corticalis TaxID=2219043 RepID=A0A402CWU5_9BACT|nr:PDZ domain-containing protein [Capsulimonas corticalis]BDI34239.1 peptide-binding protein [Capsulimonas corticalis]
MNKSSLFRTSLVAVATVACMTPAFAADFYVSPNGSDDAPGTLVKPFATLARAQKAAHSVAGKKPITINLRAGTYYLPAPLVLTSADSGASGAPVTYQAYKGEQVVVSGGRLLHPSWEPYRNGIMKASVPADCATDQLFVNGRRRILARYPNYDPNQRILGGYSADTISSERAKRWADPTGGVIHAMQAMEWGDLRYWITGKDAGGNVTYEGGWQNNRQIGMHPEQRYVENIFEELDAPDEWFLNTKSHTLYYYPPAGLDLSKAIVETVRLRSLVEMRGDAAHPVRFVRFKGITFRHTAATFQDNKEPLVRSDWTIYRGGALFFSGTENCLVENCNIEQVGGNAVFVNNYNRRLTVRGCDIPDAGSNGVAFVGSPEAVRSPLFEYGQRHALSEIDLAAGPRTNNYPADCLVEDCLICRSGRVEKQTAPVEIDLAARITVRRCSIYDVPRAGINIGDGCWGGHVIEFCDIFDTVKETGDHGSFNSWGRDRYWGLTGVDLNNDADWNAHQNLPFLDAVEPITLRNSRWRCDHGWDIDLDDGSSNYHIYNNLCLNGGIKNREGYGRLVENNIIVNNTLHPHVWFAHSGDIFRRNIVFVDAYRPAGMPSDRPWGAQMDENLVDQPGLIEPHPAQGLAAMSHRDAASIVADARFVNPAGGDFRVSSDSPALALGFKNFPMDQFGVVSPRLKAIARTPEIPAIVGQARGGDAQAPAASSGIAFGARVRNILGLGDRSVYGLPGESGVLILDTPVGSAAQKFGLAPSDVIIAADNHAVHTITDLLKICDLKQGKTLHLTVIRQQRKADVDIAM